MSDAHDPNDPLGQIKRHAERTKPFEVAMGDEESMAAITAHFDKHLGECPMVMHEIVSDLVHIDVYPVPPSKKRPYWTLYTTGMSDRPMKAPEGAEAFQYAELMIKLPPDWPVMQQHAKGTPEHIIERTYWPIRWLKMLARFPHEYDTWLFDSHSMPNGDPPEPFADDTQFCGMLVHFPLEDPEFCKIEVRPDKIVHVLTLLPMYAEEMDLKLHKGSEALTDAFAKAGIDDVVAPGRPNVATKRKKLFGLF